MAQKLTDDKKGNSTGFGRGQPDPSHILDNDMPASKCSTGLEATLMPNPGPGQVPAAHTAPPAALPEMGDRRATTSAGLILMTEASGQHFQDPSPAELPKLYPSLPVSTDGKGEENTAIRQRLHSAKEQGERTPLQMPLREYNSLQSWWNTGKPVCHYPVSGGGQVIPVQIL